MKTLFPHLTFNGTCAEAMAFYQKCFGGKVFTMPYQDSPMPELRSSKGLMHASLENDQMRMYAADVMAGRMHQPGNDFSLFIECENAAEMDKLFATLSEKGKVEMAPHDAFWGARFAALTDQFGIRWRLNLPKK